MIAVYVNWFQIMKLLYISLTVNICKYKPHIYVQALIL